jgi:hypothetical protein
LIITKFKTLSDINSYIDHLFTKDDLFSLNAQQAFLFFNNQSFFSTFVLESSLSSIDDSYLRSFLSEEDLSSYFDFLSTFRESFYWIYPFSKTKFINNVINDIIPSLRKKFFSALLNNNNVVYSSTSYCLFTSHHMTVSSFAEVNSSIDETRALEIISSNIASNAKDNEYLAKEIESLEKTIEDLKSQIDSLSKQVSDSYIITWN